MFQPATTLPTAKALSKRETEGQAKIMAYSFDKIRKRLLMEKAVPPDQVDVAIEEFRKFLLLILLGYENIGMTSQVVDEVWHAFILFTIDYTRFCQGVFGFYLHHVPNIDGAATGGAQTFRTAYREVFGSIPPIWGDEDECSGTTNCQEAPGGCDSSNCNPWGGSE